MNSFWKCEFLYFSIIHYDIVIWVVKIIQNVKAYDNYDDFQHVNIFHKNFISLSWGLFNDEIELRGKVFWEETQQVNG
jgi:hypothetical protein